MGCMYSKEVGRVIVDQENAKGQLRSHSHAHWVAPLSWKREEFRGGVESNKETNRAAEIKGPVPSNGEGQTFLARIGRIPGGVEGQLVSAGWPSWLTSVASEAVAGWLPLRPESFEKLDKIGQGTYSSVYKARDLGTGKIVAMKKVRFANRDPESVGFMAREILILRRLDHPNVVKLEGIIATSDPSCSLYLVFEYMEHDLAGLVATPGVKFTEPQIKCYMQQFLSGLDHCHKQGVLHRDLKGSNLLITNNGVLKIADFGLATFFQPDQTQQLTSRVVTLWYRAPELLLGATDYGAGIDLWSVGCILAELFAGRPTMPGRTEVEQMHKIFKLCGSPSESYWRKKKFPHATSFKPQQRYKRCISEMFNSFPDSALALADVLLAIEPENRGSAASALQTEFFTTKPFPCNPASLPKYPPSKELDIKRRNEEAQRLIAQAVVRGRGPESVRRGSRDFKGARSPEFISQGQPRTSTRKLHNNLARSKTPRRQPMETCLSHSTSMLQHCTSGRATWCKGPVDLTDEADSQTQKSTQLKSASNTTTSDKESTAGYALKKRRIHHSGPLMPPGGNIEDVLKEHDRLIQVAVWKARCDKPGAGGQHKS